MFGRRYLKKKKNPKNGKTCLAEGLVLFVTSQRVDFPNGDHAEETTDGPFAIFTAENTGYVNFVQHLQICPQLNTFQTPAVIPWETILDKYGGPSRAPPPPLYFQTNHISPVQCVNRESLKVANLYHKDPH